MTIELYASPAVPTASEHPESPISSLAGTLPDDEPSLNLGDLLGSFSTREEAMDYISQQAAEHDQVVVDSQSSPYNEYTHVEWLTVILKQSDQSTQNKSYYLVTDEGY